MIIIERLSNSLMNAEIGLLVCVYLAPFLIYFLFDFLICRIPF